MSNLKERLCAFWNNRWLVFVAAMWIQIFSGIGYLFGSISPVIKTSLNYNQRQIAKLGVAKVLGGSIGFVAGSLCEIIPLWSLSLIGALQNLAGYGWIWLIVSGRAPILPLWAMCIIIFVGDNGQTYFNTAALVSCVQNFPKSRGPVVGILKGFAGLGGAVLTQIYLMIHFSDQSSLIFMMAVGPAILIVFLMFFIRPVGGSRQIRPSDGASFTFIYTMCLLLAAYLMGVALVEDLVHLSRETIRTLSVILILLLAIPIVVPVKTSFLSTDPLEDALLPKSEKQDPGKSEPDDNEVLFSELEDERPEGVDLLPSIERRKEIAELQSRLLKAAAEGAVRVRRRRGPRRGEDFTLAQALIKADFWLIFWSFLLGSGSGVTVIDNLGQMSESLGYNNAHTFVSLISIWNFLGRVGGGYFSEIIVRDYAYPRAIALAIAQCVMAVGHVFFAMGWPGAMYIGTLLIGLCYGAHWAIVPATASELFGLKKFGALYNFLALANPLGSLVFSSVIASNIYDREAEKQAHQPQLITQNSRTLFSGMFAQNDPPKCEGSVCFFLTCMIMSGFCIVAAVLSLLIVHRTKPVYANLYGKCRN